MNTISAAHPRATRRDWIGLAVLMLPTMLIAIDGSVLHLAVPSLSEALQPTGAQLLWITDIYGFMIAGSLITMGTLGDRIGRRKLLMIGGAAFGLASILAALSTSANMLIAARALLGIAGATLMPSTMSLIRNMFLDPGQRTVAIGIWVSGFSLGSTIGPLVGGFLLQNFSWGAVFLIGVPVMAVLLITAPLLLPEYRDPHPGKFDLLSAIMSLGAVLLIIFGVKQIAESGVTVLALVSSVIGIIIGVLFVHRQRTLADPLIDMRLFRIPAFSASLATYTLGIFFAFGMFLFIAQYFQLVLGLEPLEAGAWSVPGSIAFVIGSNLAPKLVRRIRPAFIVAGGLIIAAIGLSLLTRLDLNSLMNVVVGNLLMSLGFGMTFSLTVDLVVGAAPPERAGAASAIAETGAELGGALGLAVLGSLGIAIYRNLLVPVIPTSLSAEAAHAVQETLAGALTITAELPPEIGTPLNEAARSAFVQGVQLNSTLGVIGFIFLATLVALMLRNIKPHNESDEMPEAHSIPATNTEALPPKRQTAEIAIGR